jgi:hypothetical protein
MLTPALRLQVAAPVVLDALVADIALAAPGGARTALLVDGPARFCANDAARPLGGALLTWRLYAARGWKARPLTARLPSGSGRVCGDRSSLCWRHDRAVSVALVLQVKCYAIQCTCNHLCKYSLACSRKGGISMCYQRMHDGMVAGGGLMAEGAEDHEALT